MDKVDMNVAIGVDKIAKKRSILEDACNKADEAHDSSADAKGRKFSFAKNFSCL